MFSRDFLLYLVFVTMAVRCVESNTLRRNLMHRIPFSPTFHIPLDSTEEALKIKQKFKDLEVETRGIPYFLTNLNELRAVFIRKCDRLELSKKYAECRVATSVLQKHYDAIYSCSDSRFTRAMTRCTNVENRCKTSEELRKLFFVKTNLCLTLQQIPQEDAFYEALEKYLDTLPIVTADTLLK